MIPDRRASPAWRCGPSPRPRSSPFPGRYLVDGRHAAELHQHLDNFGRLHRHLVRKRRHRDGFGHQHFANNGIRRCKGLLWTTVSVLCRPPRPERVCQLCAPPVTSPRVLSPLLFADSSFQASGLFAGFGLAAFSLGLAAGLCRVPSVVIFLGSSAALATGAAAAG